MWYNCKSKSKLLQNIYVKSLGNNMEIIQESKWKLLQKYMCEVIRKGQKIIVKTVVMHKDFTQMKSLSNLLKLLL